MSGMRADWAWIAAWAVDSSPSVSRGRSWLLRSVAMSTSARPRRRAPRTAGTSEETSLEASLIATVAPVMRHLVAHARRRRAWSELTYQQYNVLRMIDTLGPQPQAEVARRLLVTAPVVTRLAATLADAALVERRTDAKDRRRDLLEAAHELLAPIPADRRDAVGAALEELQVLLPKHSARR